MRKPRIRIRRMGSDATTEPQPDSDGASRNSLADDTVGDSSIEYDIELHSDGSRQQLPDRLAVEEPLEIRWRDPGGDREGTPLAITMRTPGSDEHLVRGWLYNEGLIEADTELRCSRPKGEDGKPEPHIVVAELPQDRAAQARNLVRRMFVNSSCGFCGKPGLEGLKLPRTPELAEGLLVDPKTILDLPRALEAGQPTFARTGGLHAAALFTAQGKLLFVEEDIGRHNALDKLIGRGLEHQMLPGGDHIVLVSGRGGYELVQKCLVANIAVLAAVSAPSSGAVSLARRYGMTLIGFLREGRFNVYSGRERITN